MNTRDSNKKKLKEQELNYAVDEMEKLSSRVKNVTKSVKLGTATKRELYTAVEDLKVQGDKVKILSAETKMLGDWKRLGEDLPKPGINKFLIIISLLALVYIVKG